MKMIKKIPRHTLASVILVILLICSVPGSTAMLMQPYLQAVTHNSIYVLVESDSTSTVTVEYGLTTSYGMTATTESYEETIYREPDPQHRSWVHNIKLTGLQAPFLNSPPAFGHLPIRGKG